MTPLQKSLARNALGLPNPRMVSYRNRYAVPYRSNIYDEWVQMSKKGYAWRGKKVGGIVAFYLTREGAKAALESGQSLCPEDFPPQDAATDRGGGMKLFRRFKGMIYPGMACTYDDASRVYKRKGIWMVEYLRSRREMVNTDRPMYQRQGERQMIKYYRRKHFEATP